MFFYLKISCKDEKILKKFIKFFFKIKSLPIFVKPFPKSKKRKFVTVLKSPHVNKTAQEQFEYCLFRKQLTLFSYKSFLLLILLKYLKFRLFPDLKFKIILFSNSTKLYKNVTNIINPNNFNSSFLLNYLKIFDLHGEILLKK